MRLDDDTTNMAFDLVALYRSKLNDCGKSVQKRIGIFATCDDRRVLEGQRLL